ncbi:heterogeneous nuclear ribonucleoprotein C-like 3 [Apostichopus japonicus]
MNRPPFMGMAARNAGVGYKAPVGKMTNNQDPKSKASRVFVGNLNTGEINDQQLYKIFAVYGMITDVSTINGFGFVQFDKIEDAQEAVRREQGRVVGDQPMDLSIANNPNPTRPKGYKRVNQQFGFTPVQRTNTPSGTFVPYVDPSLLPVIPAANYGNTQNKKMRFQSNSQVGKEQISGDEPSSWVCAFCQNKSQSAWELMKHASLSHQTQIYIANPDFEQKAE